MSKFGLRDISAKLSASADTESVISSYISYLEKTQKDWRAALAFYECSSDRLVSLYTLSGERLVSRELDLPVEDLPVRLVRKFFHHALVAQNMGKRFVLNMVFQSAPFYRAEGSDRLGLVPLVPYTDWQSCVCFPLADSEDVFAMLVVASPKKNAFPSKVLGEILPVNSVAALALAQHLYRTEKGRLEEEVRTTGARVAAEFQEKLSHLADERQELAVTIEDQARVISELVESMSHLDRDSSEYRDELKRVQAAILALEEQSSVATEFLSDAYTELTNTAYQLTEARATGTFIRAVSDLLAQDHESEDLPGLLVNWMCDYFNIERCSYMLLDTRGETMSIACARGIPEDIAHRVRVRIGQGISGWVAHNRKPLLVRARGESAVEHTGQDVYNSDSFMSVPVVHNDVLYGVLNFSNKTDASLFTDCDLDRACYLATLLALSRERAAVGRRAAVWT
jgi:GAF domain-containing protein